MNFILPKTCCGCMKLRAGVIIISILWLIYSLYNTVYGGFVVSRNPTNGAGYAFTIIYALFSLGAAYGLFVTWLANTAKNLKIYSYIAKIIISAYIVKDIAEIIFTIVSRQNYIKDCSTTLKSAGNFTDSDVNDTCVNSFNVALTSNIISTLVDAIILIYFGIVIVAYAASRKEKELLRSENGGNGEDNTGNNVNAEKEYVKKINP